MQNIQLANARSLDSIFAEYEVVRKSTLALFHNLPEESMMRSGSGLEADGTIVNRRTVRAILFHLVGHELRHFQIIKDRYITDY